MKISKRFTFSNVVSVAALIVATAGAGGGVAYAHGKVGSNQIKVNAVKSKHVKNNNLKSKDIKNNNLKGKDVKNGSLGAKDLNGKTTSGLVEAGVNVDGTGSVDSWFNRKGGKPTVAKVGTGAYRVTIPGRTSTTGSVIATAASATYNRHCEIYGVGANTSDLYVACSRTTNDALLDTRFRLVLFKS